MLITCGTHHLSMNEFKDRVTDAAIGTTVVYAVGDLARDRLFGRAEGDPNVHEMVGVADLAWRMHERGEVALTQRRLHDGRFEYRATKIQPPTVRAADGPRIRRVLA